MVETAMDLQAARHCREIDGNLQFRGQALEAIGADDLPYLERVTGSLISAGGKPMRELTLPALREVGSDASPGLIEIVLDAKNLQRIALPRLQRVRGSIGIFGLYALVELDLGALTRVDDSFVLTTLPRLSSLELSPELQVGKLIQFAFLCSLPSESFAPPAGDRSFEALGCCTESALGCDTLQCTCE
jgi:hypothetical protein